MGTPALIHLDDPDRGATEFLRVHYDGDLHTRDALNTLIARDGYPTVRRTLIGQVSRFWVGLDPQIEDIPDYVASYPTAWSVAAVPGYGLVFTGQEEITASTDASAFDPGTWWGVQWRVSPAGRVSSRS
ncbi:hypothetical protein [Mycolicibacterium aubagnense]|uniref:Uncharacterized protein n=1 Tax=Mycolicibacterium aubagnense TaxID=319707 RepID=A0ABN5YPZ7_9MYCO|nr:hypothetical protein [Mycolicibacterium aubagnense]TLH64441.1 hypothetical protein C1S80_12210 [Mycolicibacterium aubagnense]BBX82174.1 hypothetical protein MAUB_00470 [Mycolicibacterium aubagnense]